MRPFALQGIQSHKNCTCFKAALANPSRFHSICYSPRAADFSSGVAHRSVSRFLPTVPLGPVFRHAILGPISAARRGLSWRACDNWGRGVSVQRRAAQGGAPRTARAAAGARHPLPKTLAPAGRAEASLPRPECEEPPVEVDERRPTGSGSQSTGSGSLESSVRSRSGEPTETGHGHRRGADTGKDRGRIAAG